MKGYCSQQVSILRNLRSELRIFKNNDKEANELWNIAECAITSKRNTNKCEHCHNVYQCAELTHYTDKK